MVLKRKAMLQTEERDQDHEKELHIEGLGGADLEKGVVIGTMVVVKATEGRGHEVEIEIEKGVVMRVHDIMKRGTETEKRRESARGKETGREKAATLNEKGSGKALGPPQGISLVSVFN